MPSEYNQITAFHYSAYRPSLHLPILKECLKKEFKCELGLDIGCGTGQSSIALFHFCKKVIGIEPSQEMLQQAIKHPKVEYRHYNGKNIKFPSDYFDLLTFAGSLYYAKSQEMLDEVVRVGKNTSKIIVYDFEILLDSFLKKLNIDLSLRPASSYNHQANFDGLNQEGVKIEKEFQKTLSLEIAMPNIAHLLLSSKDNYNLLLESFGAERLHHAITQQLNAIFEAKETKVGVKTYSTVYRIIKQQHEKTKLEKIRL